MCTETETKTTEEKGNKEAEELNDELQKNDLMSMVKILDLYYEDARKDYTACKQKVANHIFPHLENLRQLSENLTIDRNLDLLDGYKGTIDEDDGMAGSSLKS